MDDILAVGADHVAIATGAKWRRDGFGVSHDEPISLKAPDVQIFTPDDIMEGTYPHGSVVVYDDDGFYMGSVISEKLRLLGNDVIYLTPASKVSHWSENNAEQPRVHCRLDEIGVEIILNQTLEGFDGDVVTVSCSYTGKEKVIKASNVVMVTCRTPQDDLYHELLNAIENKVEGAPKSVKRIGDAEAPSIIAAAVYAGHKYARELDCEIDKDNPAKHDRVFFEENA